MEKKVLFVSYGGGHVRLLDQVYQHLVGQDGITATFLGLTGAYPYLAARYTGNTIRQLSDYAPLFSAEADHIRSYGESLLAENYNPELNISREETIFYLGASYYDLVSRIGAEAAEQQYTNRKRQAFHPVSILRRILQDMKADLVVTTNSPRCESAAILAARELGIPSLQLLDLFGDDYPVPDADHIVVLNDAVAQKLRAAGNLRSTFYPLGQPIFDETVNNVQSIDAGGKRESLGLKNNKKNLLYCPPNGYFIFNDDISVKEIRDMHVITQPAFDVLDSLIARHPVNVLVRPHPSQSIDAYTPYIENKPGYYHFDNTELDLFASLAVSDAIVTYNSTVAVQAAINQKAVFTYNCDSGQKYHWRELMQSPFIYATDVAEMERNLEKYLTGELSAATDDKKFYTPGAAANIVSLIKDLI